MRRLLQPPPSTVFVAGEQGPGYRVGLILNIPEGIVFAEDPIRLPHLNLDKISAGRRHTQLKPVHIIAGRACDLRFPKGVVRAIITGRPKFEFIALATEPIVAHCKRLQLPKVCGAGTWLAASPATATTTCFRGALSVLRKIIERELFTATIGMLNEKDTGVFTVVDVLNCSTRTIALPGSTRSLRFSWLQEEYRMRLEWLRSVNAGSVAGRGESAQRVSLVNESGNPDLVSPCPGETLGTDRHVEVKQGKACDSLLKLSWC